ncbi:monooxygenase 3-like isoform X2 [Prosopis cineraria]|uniref:monooxygenase 3-like isoform X2 n=1 Tax=Prosopis cineraria TaxID=364024 RepID=UPI00240F3C99|nr:monooxygenase 3-like isoform X2 [Prosopis cineraria]
MESRVEDIVIVGAGIAGLATSLGLHRNVTTSLITGQQTSTTAFVNATGKHGVHEVRRVRRQLLLEVLANELPSGTIRYSSKVVAIEESGFTKLIHLADGTIIRTKVLIGCDGVNSIVAKWLGLNKAAFSGRFGIRGCITLKNSHKLEPLFMQFFGKGYRNGVMPCDDKTVHWFFNWTPTCQEKKLEENPAQMKQFVLEKLKNMPSDIRAFIENTDLDHFLSSPLRYRHPWELVFGNINKSNVCVAGDAFHPMTPDLGQGGCCALEDGIVLARCLGEVFSMKSSRDIRKKDNEEEEEEQYKKIEMSLKKYANERRWRSIIIISAAYMTGVIQQGQSKLVSFFRDKFFTPILAGFLLKASDFDCGKLSNF